MLVILIIGILVSGVTLAVSGKDPGERLSDEALRLQAKLQLASDFSLLNNVELGLFVKEREYSFLYYEEQRWQAIDDQPALEMFELEEDYKLELTFDDLPIQTMPYVLGQGFESEEQESALTEEERELLPQVMIFPGGEVTPFRATITFTDPDFQDWSIAVESNGFVPIVIDRGEDDDQR